MNKADTIPGLLGLLWGPKYRIFISTFSSRLTAAVYEWKALLSSLLSLNSNLGILFDYTHMENVLFYNPNKNLVYVHAYTMWWVYEKFPTVSL